MIVHTRRLTAHTHTHTHTLSLSLSVPHTHTLSHSLPCNLSHTQTIGRGNFAKVRLARHKFTQVEVAIKIIQKKDMSDNSLYKVGWTAAIKLLPCPLQIN